MDEQNKPQIVILNDNLTIQNAGHIKEQLNVAVDLNNRIFIQFDTINKVDLSFFQLICATHKTCVRQKKELVIHGNIPDIIIHAAKSLGFIKHVGCTSKIASCMWQKPHTLIEG